MKSNMYRICLLAASVSLTAQVEAQTLIYNITPGSGAANATVAVTSSTDLAAIYGDRLQTTAGGKLSEFKFAVFCSGSSSGNLISATETIRFYQYDASADQGIGTSLGSFTVSLGALTKGVYRIETVSNLESLNIVLPQDFIVTQQLSNVVGASKMGTVLTQGGLGTSAVGTSDPGMYLKNSLISAGFYTFTGFTSSSQAIYSVTVVPVPEPATYAGLAAFGLVGFATWRRIRR